MTSKLYLMLLVLLGVAAPGFSDDCPDAEAVFPCTCKKSKADLEVFCHDEDMTQKELKNILATFNEEYTLRLAFYYVNLGTVPTDFLQGFNIKVLSFIHCKFDQIPDEERRVFVGLEDTLQELTMIDSIERRNSSVVLDLSHLKNLIELHLSQNTISELGDGCFQKGPTSLTHLYINDNGIEKLGNNAFANLPNLKKLWLDGNQFGEMKRSMLPNPATHLEDLHLDDNDFWTFPDDFFIEMPALKSLSLKLNKFYIIREVTFRNIWTQLDYLDLQGNALNCEDDVVEWMVMTSRTPLIMGVCAKPPEREGDNMLDVINGKQATQEYQHG